MLDGREERDQTMSPGPDFSGALLPCVVSVVDRPLVGKVAVTALLSHFLGSSLQVQWKRKYASYLVVRKSFYHITLAHFGSSYHPGPAIGQWVYNV